MPLSRRQLLAALPAMPAVAAQQYERRTRGLAPLTIREVKAIPTSAGGNYQWVFLKIVTSEAGLYGLGSASNVNQAFSVLAAIEKHLGPFWIGKNPDRIEDLWQSTNVR